MLPAIFLSTCSEKSEYGDASDYEKLGASCDYTTGDTTSPTVFSLSPSDNSSNVPVASQVVVMFSDKMLATSISTNTADTICSGSFQLSSDNFSTCIKMSAAPVASDNDTTFTITPASSLSKETNYKFKITTSVSETSCNKLVSDNITINGFTTAGTGSGTIQGKVISDLDNSYLSGVKIGFYGTTIDNTTTNSGGEFDSEVDVGDYTISYSKSGYLDESQDVPLETDGQTLEVSTIRMLSTNCESTGNISGNITDAVLASKVIEGVYLEARRGFNRPWRRVKATDTTDSSGNYSFSSLKRGWYTVKTSKNGYINGKFYVRSCGDVSNQNYAISETLPHPKSMRIVLDWQTTDPVTGYDLDSHIKIPDNSSQAWHLHHGVDVAGSDDDYYHYGAGDNVTLDRDDLDGPPGIETITIIQVRSNFTYSYSVHDWTNKSDSSSIKLANSGATVTVYSGSALPNSGDVKKYSVPSGAGNLWRVFTFTESGGLTKVNTMTSELTYTNVY